MNRDNSIILGGIAILLLIILLGIGIFLAAGRAPATALPITSFPAPTIEPLPTDTGFFDTQPAQTFGPVAGGEVIAPLPVLASIGEAISNGVAIHSTLILQGQAIDNTATATIDAWATRRADGNYLFRTEVIDTSISEEKGLLAVSNGDTFWIYSPRRNKVWIGDYETLERNWVVNLPLLDVGEFSLSWLNLAFQLSAMPDTTSNGFDATRVDLEPGLDFLSSNTAISGLTASLWVDGRGAPLQTGIFLGSNTIVSYTASEVAYVSAPGTNFFTYRPPAGVTRVDAEQLLVQHGTLAQAEQRMSFDILEPGQRIGTVRVDVATMGASVWQQYASLNRAFAVVQTESTDLLLTAGIAQRVNVRGQAGWYIIDSSQTYTTLNWRERGITFIVGGRISPQEAIQIAGSLR